MSNAHSARISALVQCPSEGGVWVFVVSGQRITQSFSKPVVNKSGRRLHSNVFSSRKKGKVLPCFIATYGSDMGWMEGGMDWGALEGGHGWLGGRSDLVWS